MPLKRNTACNDEATKATRTSCCGLDRLVERGVRFIQCRFRSDRCGGDSRNWDAHQSLEENHSKHAKAVDKPIAGLLADLKERGLLIRHW